MALAPGTKLGPYEIAAPLGAGGMGEVYRARDTRLGRDVAIKVLPQHLSANPEIRARFEREAKTVSSLNHPNICTLFDVGREGDTDYLVMELIDGETLAQRLVRGALPIADVLRLGAQIADALDRAHRAGVVHRDLKPGNVMLTRSGAKLMDFGLARATGMAGPAGASGVTVQALTQSPTIAGPLTAEGTIIGTFQYMSPEQLEGKDADARSDIWALGCVLYEMASGRRAFSGASQASLIGAIMNTEPPSLSEVAPLSPPVLDRLVRQCLAKDPDERWQSARDLARELGAIAPASGSGPAVAGHARRRGMAAERMAWAGLVLLATAGAIVWGVATRPGARDHVVSSIELPPGLGFSVTHGPIALSPDGRGVAFVAADSTGTTSLWVRFLDDPAPHALSGTANATEPFWSPDGRDVGFFADAQLKRIGVSGGSAQTLGPAVRPRGGSWGRNGFILFVGERDAGVVRVPASGGAVVVVDSSRSSIVREPRWPSWFPDGRHFVFSTSASAAYPWVKDGVYVASTGRGEQPRLLVPGAMNAFFADGRLYFWRDGALWAQALDVGRLELTGAAAQVAQQVTFDGFLECALFSAARSGSVVYLEGSNVDVSELAWFDRAGRELGTLGPPASYYAPRLSHDGRRVAVDRSDPITGEGDIWIFDIPRNLGDRFTSDPANETGPIWSPDDSRLYWMSAKAATGGGDIFTRLVAGAHEDVAVYRSPDLSMTGACAPDGASLVFTRVRHGIGNLAVLSLADAKMRVWVETPFRQSSPRLSRDGHWIAYTSDESGEFEIYVQRFPEGGERWRISSAGGTGPVWRADGREVFYVEKDRQLMAVPFRAQPTVDVGAAVPLFRTRFQPNPLESVFDVTADGRFLVNRMVQARTKASLALEQGWALPK